MGFLQSAEEDFRLLYLGGGAVHGVSQAQLLIFLEEVTGIPIAWQFDMISGDSIGSDPAVGLACPIKKGSKTPKFTAAQYAEILKQLCQEIFEPYQENYHTNMVKLEIELKLFEKTIEIIENWSGKKDQAFANALDSAAAMARNIGRKIGLPFSKHTAKTDNADKNTHTRRFNLVSGAMELTALPILRKLLERSKGKVKNFFFSPEPVHNALDRHLVFEDGSPVMLHDAITGLHVDSFNICRREPESHIFIKPIKRWKGFISHENLPLAEIPKRSMPAQTIFKPYYSPVSKCYYDDIAHHNTMAAAMNSIRRKFNQAQESGQLKVSIKRHGVSIGTGIFPPKIDPERMGELLILGRLDSEEGAPLLKIPLLFNTSKAIRDLKEELGPENAVFIDKIVDEAIVNNTYKYRESLKKYKGVFSKRHIRQNFEEEVMRLPKYDLIDARPEKIAQLEDFGWTMVWDNLEALVNEAKLGLERALRHKLITESFYNKRLKAIDEIFPPENLNKKPQSSSSILDFLRFGGSLPRFSLFDSSPTPNNQP